jgi:hypothetical protein
LEEKIGEGNGYDLNFSPWVGEGAGRACFLLIDTLLVGDGCLERNRQSGYVLAGDPFAHELNSACRGFGYVFLQFINMKCVHLLFCDTI